MTALTRPEIIIIGCVKRSLIKDIGKSNI